MSEIGNVLTRLTAVIESRKGASPNSSYTASLLAKGPERCAKKMGEEAVETALAGAVGRKADLADEAADLLYHLGILLAANEMTYEDVAQVLISREGTSGHEEKASRG